MTKPDGNPDSDRLSKSIEQNINLDRNEGQLHAVTSGDRSNVILGDGSQITQIHHHYVKHPSAEEKRERLPRFWSDRRFVLLFWGCAIVGILGVVETVFQPLKAYQQRMAFQECAKVAREENKPLVIIADFAFDNKLQNSRSNPWIEQQIKDDPGGLNNLSGLQTCTLYRVVSNADEAKKVGSENKADILIWGRGKNLSLEIQVISIVIDEMPTYLRKIPILAKTQNDFNQKLEDIPPLVTIMTANHIGFHYFFEYQTNNAITILKQALNLSHYHIKINSEVEQKVLSQAYFRLGTWFSPEDITTCSNEILISKCKKALSFYRQATDINPSLYKALYNSGLINEALGNLTDARRNYLSILSSSSDSLFRSNACKQLRHLNSEAEKIELECFENN